MNVTELRDALDDLAGSLVAPTTEQRQSVRRRVRRARLVRVIPATALILAVAVGSIVVVSNGTGDDRPTRVVTSRDRIVHDEEVGYSVAIPRGWKLDVLQPDGTVLAGGVRLIHANFAQQARQTNKQFQNLAPIQAERTQLAQRLATIPPESPEFLSIYRRIDDLNNAEVEIRMWSNDLRPVLASRRQLEQQLEDPSLSAPDRAAILSRIDPLNEAEVRIRSRQRKGCVSPEQREIHLAVMESTGFARPRPARFGPRSGTGLEPKRTSPGCRQLVQSMRFTDAGRTFALSVKMPTGTGPRRRAETYTILNDIRFDPR